MHKYLDINTMLFAMWIYQRLTEKPDEKIVFYAKDILFHNIIKKFKTKEEEQFWLDNHTAYYDKLKKNILPYLSVEFNLKYEIIENGHFFTQENIYCQDITDEESSNLNRPFEILDLEVTISDENSKFIEQYEEYIGQIKNCKIFGKEIYTLQFQEEIIENLIQAKQKKTNNPYLIFNYDELEKMNKENPIAILEFFQYQFLYNNYVLDKLDLIQENGHTLVTKLEKIELHCHKNIENYDDVMKKTIKFIKKGKYLYLNYCGKEKQLEPKLAKIVEYINAENNKFADKPDFVEDFGKQLGIEKDNLQSSISTVNKQLKDIQKELQITTNNFIVSDKDSKKAVNYRFSDSYNIEFS